MNKIIEIEGKKQVLEVSVSYDLGGWNYGSGLPKKRGYYLSVQPTTIEGGFKKISAFTGVRMLLIEVGRKSNKQYENACAMVTDELIEKMKAQCTFED